MSKLSEASHETIILEASYVKIVGSLARNDHFGSFLCQNCWKPRKKGSFWKLLMSKSSEASHETIILEASYVKIVGSLARNNHFGTFLCQNCREPRTERSFWELEKITRKDLDPIPTHREKLGVRLLREMRTIAGAVDEIARGKPEAAGDILSQRLKALELQLVDNSWQRAQFLELIP